MEYRVQLDLSAQNFQVFLKNDPKHVGQGITIQAAFRDLNLSTPKN